MMLSVEDRFWDKVIRLGNDECWPWMAGVTKKGYGDFWAGRRIRAHRFAYELMVGPVPEGLQLDHLCHNRCCVNPAHLEPVTAAENLRRGENHAAERARQTHCKFGHEFTEENTYRYPNARRECRICRKRIQDERTGGGE